MTVHRLSLRFFSIFCILSAAGTGIFALDVSDLSFSVPSVRSSSLGGMHAALADDFDALFSNPAGFVSADSGLSISRIGLGLSGPVFTLSGLVLKGMDDSNGDLLELIASDVMMDTLKSFHVESSVSGPLQFGYVGNGLGFGLFNTTKLVMESGGSTLGISADMREQFLLNGGYAMRVPLPSGWNTTLDAGILLKAFLTGDVLVESSLFELASLTTERLMKEPFVLTSGIGMDTGILLDYNRFIRFGIVGRNVYTPVIRTEYAGLGAYLDGDDSLSTDPSIVPTDLSAGIVITPSLKFLENILTGMKVMLDYKNILDFVLTPEDASNPILHVGTGLEFTVLDVLAVRLGMDQGLFAAGIGLDLSWFSFQAGMYGQELSHEPGMKPIFNMFFSIDFRY